MTLATPTQVIYTAPVRIDVSTMPKLHDMRLKIGPHPVLLSTLTQTLTVKRGADGVGEATFAAWLANRLPVSMIDSAGNIHVDRRGATGRTLFTAHLDTVHHKEGANTVRIDTTTEPGQVFWRADGDALGADDGAGVALLAHMIDSNVPGYYVFFRGEECGGIGSKHMAQHMAPLLKEFDRAVAFDRAGYYDVITHQAGGQCASDEFAQALADQFNAADPDFFFLPCSGGVYTDTAEFIGLIPECTNISVGYFSQHGDRENTNVTFLMQLAAAVLLVQWDTLPTVRLVKKAYSKPRGLGTTDWWSDQGFTRLDGTSYDEPDTSAEDVLDALERACDGDTRELFDRMCETGAYLYAMTVTEAQGYVRAGRLTVDVCSDSLTDLMGGTDPDLILSDLYDYCCN